jgi:hypothetical protein
MEVGKSEKAAKLFEFYKEGFLYVCRELTKENVMSSRYIM